MIQPRIRLGVIDRVSNSRHAAQLNADGGKVYGFQLKDNLLLYEEEISVSEYRTTLRTLLNGLWQAKEFLIKSYKIRDALGGDSSALPRGYQQISCALFY